jgi:hypothetical protein
MQHADLHQRIKLRAYLLWERKGSPRDERRTTGCALRRRWRVSTLAGGGAPRDARHRRPYYDGAADQIARAHLPGVRRDRRLGRNRCKIYAAAPAAFDVSEP